MAEVCGQNFTLRYCKHCKLLRNLRVFHCKTCNLCITRHDHHCPWVSKCIGAGNHKLFIWMIIMIWLHCLGTASILAYIFDIVVIHKETSLNPDILSYVTTIILLGFNMIVLLFVTTLIVFQIRGIFLNQTTSEFIKAGKGHKNPFDLGCKENFTEFCCDISKYIFMIKLNDSASACLSNVLLTDFFYKSEDLNSTELTNTSLSSDKTLNEKV
jgi:hypothetical protein